MENKMNKILMETKGSELQKLIERMDMDMGTHMVTAITTKIKI